MNRLSKTEIGWHGIVAALEGLLKKWRPGTKSTELQYSDALAAYLRAALPEDARIEREYRHEGTTCDVCVLYKGILNDAVVLIEVKRNLRKKTDYDRLVGQVEGLKPRKNQVVVALVGDTDPALSGRLREQFKEYIDDDDLEFALVEVS